MDRWRQTIVQIACIGAIVALAVTQTPDREMKLAALTIIGMLAAATVSRAKLDGAIEALGKGGGMAAIASALQPSSLPPPREPPAVKRVLSIVGLVAAACAFGAVMLLIAAGCSRGPTVREGATAASACASCAEEVAPLVERLLAKAAPAGVEPDDDDGAPARLAFTITESGQVRVRRPPQRRCAEWRYADGGITRPPLVPWVVPEPKDGGGG